MRQRPNLQRLARPSTASLVLPVGGCSAAPSQDILGSFFPAWMLCAAIGVLAAALSRWLLTAAGIGNHLLAPPLVYLAIAVAVTLLTWLAWFGG